MVVKNASTMEKNESISVEESCVEELVRLLCGILPPFPSAYICRRSGFFGQKFTLRRGPNDMQGWRVDNPTRWRGGGRSKSSRV